MSDTIFALSSGAPPAAIAVVRVSGPRACDALKALTGRVPEPRQATLARLRDPRDSAVIDDALLLWFPAPRSETGEDIAEFQLHGGRAVIVAMLRALARIPGLRLAEPGEFVRRAFANGKLDLTRVEALADLIGAETDTQRRQALRQLNGFLAGRAENWRARLTEAMALVEALIDFPEEEVPATLVEPALAIASELKGEIDHLLADDHRGERLRDGLRIAIAGPVNVGKSSIVNFIAKRPAAIVSPYAGTTRDVIEVHLDLDGYPVTVLDTAGLRDSDDPVEQEGMRRAREHAREADLVLWIVDASDPDPPRAPGLTPNKLEPPLWIVANKSDLVDSSAPTPWNAAAATGQQSVGPCPRDNSSAAVSAPCVRYRISARTGACFDALLAGMTQFARDFFGKSETVMITRERHRAALAACSLALGRALAEGSSDREEIVAEELRAAATALGRLTGRIDVENVLDAIFREFCIGK